MHDATSQLSRLVECALAGEEVVVTRRGHDVVRLEPVARPAGLAALRGVWRGRVRMAEDVDDLPPGIAEALGMR
jgi:antitoxin (DNA-binding transcriptional repressor) of toxin-antitoxin stability system